MNVTKCHLLFNHPLKTGLMDSSKMPINRIKTDVLEKVAKKMFDLTLPKNV